VYGMREDGLVGGESSGVSARAKETEFWQSED
jgi:hypothetical protein